MNIKLLVEGGSMKPGPALSQKLGPAGIPLNKVIEQVNEATKNFKGLKVPVELEVDLGTKEFEINVSSPPVSELLKKELGIEKGSATQKKLYTANASIEEIISVAKTKLPTMLCKDLKAAVKTVIGTCASLGILIENQLASDLGHQIAGGKFSKEIEEEKTETAPEKKAELKEYFDKVQSEQQTVIKQEEAAKEAEAEKKKEETAEAKHEEGKEETVEEKPEEKKT